MNLIRTKELASYVWYSTLGSQVCEYTCDIGYPDVLYISYEKPLPFDLDLWKKWYCVLYKNNGIYYLYLTRQNNNTILVNDIPTIGSGKQGLELLRELCCNIGIKNIYIEDEAEIETSSGSFMLSDREDLLYGTHSWYLRFFELEEEKEYFSKRRDQILSLKHYYKDLELTPSNIISIKEFLKNSGIEFPTRNFLARISRSEEPKQIKILSHTLLEFYICVYSQLQNILRVLEYNNEVKDYHNEDIDCSNLNLPIQVLT